MDNIRREPTKDEGQEKETEAEQALSSASHESMRSRLPGDIKQHHSRRRHKSLKIRVELPFGVGHSQGETGEHRAHDEEKQEPVRPCPQAFMKICRILVSNEQDNGNDQYDRQGHSPECPG